MSIFNRQPYTIQDINTYMANIQALRASLSQNLSMYRTSQVKASDGSIRRDETYKKLADQDAYNLEIANELLGRMLIKMRGKEKPPVVVAGG